MYTRYSKIVLVWAIAFFSSLAAFGNLNDYDSNYELVRHVLKMDTTFPDNKGMWRAIDSPLIHHVVYSFIILAEAIIALLCWLGGFRLFKSINDPQSFNKAKKIAILGLTLGIILWFTGFMTIGGEWFLMWQSTVANGQQAAFRLVVILSLALIFLVQPDGKNQE
ncbi:MAG: DUF2165 domain-containing protein [Nitrosomonas sp.]|nr:DUF2165 domain-containing protein [Nitrosomonas sp.]MDP1951417.1 DUF2165 domain-containing protein [Nitrosomonas sp.]